MATIEEKDMWMGSMKSYISHTLRAISDNTGCGATDHEMSMVLENCKEAIKWIAENQSAEGEVIKARLLDLEFMNQPIAERLRRFPDDDHEYPPPVFDGKDMWVGVFKAYCSSKLRFVGDVTDRKITGVEKSNIMERCTEAIQWLTENRSADADVIQEKLKNLQQVCDPIVAKYTATTLSGTDASASVLPSDSDQSDDEATPKKKKKI